VSRHRPPLVGTVDHHGVSTALDDAGKAEEVRGDSRSALHPRGSRWQEWWVLAMLHEAPPVVAIASVCSPPAQTAASTMPALPAMMSVSIVAGEVRPGPVEEAVRL
jgi:hypothetical protein